MTFPDSASRWRSDPLPARLLRKIRQVWKPGRFCQKLWQGWQFIWKWPGECTTSVRGKKARDESHSRRRSKDNVSVKGTHGTWGGALAQSPQIIHPFLSKHMSSAYLEPRTGQCEISPLKQLTVLLRSLTHGRMANMSCGNNGASRHYLFNPYDQPGALVGRDTLPTLHMKKLDSRDSLVSQIHKAEKQWIRATPLSFKGHG